MKTHIRTIGFFKFTLTACAMSWFVPEPAEAVGTNRLFAAQNRASTPNYQLFLNLHPDSSTASSGPLYSLGGVYGSDFKGDTLYAVELENGGTNDFLAVIPHEGALVGQGYRVAPSTPIGFSDVEGLAVAEGIVYATSLNYAGHHTRLITINSTTGAGSLVGTTATDIMLVGLAYDPVNQIMYGAGIPFATESQARLYQVNRLTGQATAIGPLGAAIQSLSWDVDLGLIGAFAKLYQINPLTGTATQIGTGDFTDGKPGTFNGIYALAAYVPASALPFALRSIAVANNNVVVTWDSTAGATYQVESRGPLTSGTWTNLSGSIVGANTNISYTNLNGGGDPMKLFRVKRMSGP